MEVLDLMSAALTFFIYTLQLWLCSFVIMQHYGYIQLWLYTTMVIVVVVVVVVVY